MLGQTDCEPHRRQVEDPDSPGPPQAHNEVQRAEGFDPRDLSEGPDQPAQGTGVRRADHPQGLHGDPSQGGVQPHVRVR